MVVSFISFVAFFLYNSLNLRLCRRNTWDTGKQKRGKKQKQKQKKKKKQEPVSSASRRGTRAAYHDKYPRYFGLQIAYTIVSRLCLYYVCELSFRYQSACDPVSVPISSPESAFLLVSLKNTDCGQIQSMKSANHGLPTRLRRLRNLNQWWLSMVTRMDLHCDCA